MTSEAVLAMRERENNKKIIVNACCASRCRYDKETAVRGVPKRDGVSMFVAYRCTPCDLFYRYGMKASMFQVSKSYRFVFWFIGIASNYFPISNTNDGARTAARRSSSDTFSTSDNMD